MAQPSISDRDPAGRRRKGAYAVGTDTASRRPGWLIPLLALLALLALGLILFFALRGGDSDSSVPAAAATTAGNAPTATASATASVTSSPSGGTGGQTSGIDGQLLAGTQVVLPLVAGSTDLSRYAGQAATARTVTVQSVPADEGFWVGSSATDRAWVQLTGGDGESPVTVKTGDRISFAGGRIVTSPAGYAAKVGVDAGEGAAQLAAQKAHVEIAKTAIKLSS